MLFVCNNNNIILQRMYYPDQSKLHIHICVCSTLYTYIQHTLLSNDSRSFEEYYVVAPPIKYPGRNPYCLSPKAVWVFKKWSSLLCTILINVLIYSVIERMGCSWYIISLYRGIDKQCQFLEICLLIWLRKV